MATASHEGNGGGDDNPLQFGRVMAHTIEACGLKGKALVDRIRSVSVPFTQPLDLASAVIDVLGMTAQLKHNAYAPSPEDWKENTALMGVRFATVYDPPFKKQVENYSALEGVRAVF